MYRFATIWFGQWLYGGSEACTADKHKPHVGDLRHIPTAFLVEARAISEHVTHVSDTRRIPPKVLIEAGATGEHVGHVGYTRRIPHEVLVEARATSEHGAHVSDLRCVPVGEVLIEPGAFSEHSSQRAPIREDRRFVTEYLHVTTPEHALHRREGKGSPRVNGDDGTSSKAQTRGISNDMKQLSDHFDGVSRFNWTRRGEDHSL